jgi:hypothetical protein
MEAEYWKKVALFHIRDRESFKKKIFPIISSKLAFKFIKFDLEKQKKYLVKININ